MANPLTKTITIALFLSIMLFFTIISHTSAAEYNNNNDVLDDDDIEEYVLDDVTTNNTTNIRASSSGSRPSRSLRREGHEVIRKGTRCNAAPAAPWGRRKSSSRRGRGKKNVCDGVWANRGRSLLYCCKSNCRNVLGDLNNCGACGRRCRYGQRCCGGRCTNVLFSRYNCGKCGNKCRRGVACDNGYCGYA